MFRTRFNESLEGADAESTDRPTTSGMSANALADVLLKAMTAQALTSDDAAGAVDLPGRSMEDMSEPDPLGSAYPESTAAMAFCAAALLPEHAPVTLNGISRRPAALDVNDISSLEDMVTPGI
jgi:hypothetical protein